jgi:hypothetical protein
MKALFALALAAAVLAPIGSATPGSRELPRSPNWKQGVFGKLAPRTTYTASLVEPTPSVRPSDDGWVGTQIVTHQFGKIRYESVAFLGYHGEIDLITGPAMTQSPQEALDWTWNRRWDRPFGPVRQWKVAGHQAVAFDGTNTGQFEFTLVGANPPELQIDRGQSFRLAAFAVRGKTVLLAIRAANGSVATYLPAAMKLLASLEFPAS